MAFVPALNTAKIEIAYTQQDSNAVNILWARDETGAPDATRLQTLAETVRDEFMTGMMNNLSNQLDLDYIRCTAWNQPEDEQYTLNVNDTGSILTGVSPANVALVMSWRTGLTGRSRRGRSYIPGIPEENLSGNQAGSALITAFLVNAGAYLVGLAAENFTPVVASFISNGVARASALLTPITGVLVNSRVDTQRRRLPPSWS